ncbi:diguanylate cyclase [Halothiobacillus diazotrophicus]|uniref:diguanylate cyclase n=1 Tax=Halothiobacillus diazotrophicus TaxID=1860122 RepID=A0A191ZG19_9GAMM|nr:GGDEF domain-containing protein [Halothiobacillus diazotrophicus]ANJ66800.1 diguanylate cyclase [Halothiobacillus diazotrophicus]
MLKTKNVFRALAWGMVTMGVIMGAVFPLFVMLFGVAEATAFSTLFMMATLVAGFAVGILNYFLASKIVRPRLRRLSEGMKEVSEVMDQAAFTGDWSGCDPAVCLLTEQDEGELGAVAGSYNALLYALHDAHQIESQIRHFTQTLSSSLELNELGDQALTLLQEIATAQGGAIVMDRQGEWKLLVSHGLAQPDRVADSELFQVRQGEAIVRRIVLPPGVTVDAVLTHFVPADVILAPIMHHGLVLGWVVLASSTTFPDRVPRLLPMLMQGLGLALNNALMHDDLQRVAALDPLTNVYNRRFGMKRLDEELSRAARNKTPLALMMLDLDHFKRINDTFGHLSGDKVLVRMTNVTREMLREGDILLRYGGEEFVVVLPGASLQDAREVAERIRFAISHSPVDVGDHALTVTASIGVSAISGSRTVSSEELITMADKRLYAAKAAGRNRVIYEGIA